MQLLHKLRIMNEKLSRFTIIYSTIVTIGLVFSCLAFIFYKSNLETISVKKLVIIDEEGKPSLVLANKKLMPMPILDGKEYERDINPSGLVIYNNKGNECGGFGVVNVPEGEKIVFALDYATSDAIALYKTESSDGTYYSSGLGINDPNPNGQIGDAINRINLESSNKNASLEIKDSKGIIRIKITVEDSIPKFLIYDDKGILLKNLFSD
jgi:hypothetical protein